METKLAIEKNDVHSGTFQSKLDPYFTQPKPKPKPRLKFVNQGILGVSSPVKKP